MMKYLMVNCKEATFLMAKKEEGLLSLTEKWKLAMHTSMCAYCKEFERQASRIGKESKHIHAQEELPAVAKEKMERMFKDHSS